MSIDLNKAKNLSASFPEDIPECRNLKSTLDYAKCYSKLGFTVIPLKPRDKVPIVEWKQYQDPSNKPSDEDLEKWFKGTDNNIGIVCGRASGNLVALDLDDPLLLTDLLNGLESQDPELFRKIQDTLKNATKDGYHILLRVDMDPNEFARLFPSPHDVIPHKLDIRAEGGYIVVPPSIHPDSTKDNIIRYHFIPDDSVLAHVRPALITYDEWQTIMEVLGIPPEKYPGIARLSQDSQSAKPKSITKPKDGANCRELGDIDIIRIENLLEPYYVKNHRDYIIMYTLGAFVKANICYESAKKFVELITNETKDEEKAKRLYLVDYHYGKRVNNPGIGKLKGLSGLREELENIMRERGESEDTIAQKVSEIIMEISSILGIQRETGGVAWLKRRGKQILKWVSIGRQGVYIFTRGEDNEEPLVTIITHAKIGEVHNIKIIGLDFKDYYAVDLEGEKIIGTIDEIIDIIKKRYGIEPGYQYAVARLIDYMSEDEEELYYSPGPWVVNNKIAFAHEPGYTPTWKKYVHWNIRTEDPGEEMVRKALETIKTLVLAYRDPSKPSTVLSYAVMSTISVYIKEKLTIFPHLIIHGLNESGKSVLLDFIKLLFNITWSDEIPGTEYQTRLLLTTSTLPAIVDELGSVLTGKNAQAVLGVLHDSATKIALRTSGGHEYAGYYLAIRSLIGATNTDISLLPWQMDKFIFIEVSRKEAIDISKARGATPRTMDPNVKLAVQYVGYLLIKGLEKKLSEIDKLRELPRDELKKRILEIGYNVWADLYRKYGLEPFPPPSESGNEITQTTIEEEYRDLFISYIRRCLSKPQNNLPLIVVHGENKDIEDDINALENLETYGAIIDKNTSEVLMKTAFLDGFMQWAEEEYGLQKLGWKRLAEILELKETTRKIGGKRIAHLLAFKLDFI